MRAVEQLAHRDRRGALLPDLAEIGDVLGRKRVLDEEQLELFEILAELDGLIRSDSLVDVVQELNFVAELFPAGFEQFHDLPAVGGRLE